MQIHCGHLNQLPPLATPVGLTIGNFDGVHLGHQYLLEKLVEGSRQRGAEPVVLCFDPHPEQLLSSSGLPLLTTVDQKAEVLSKLGVKHLILQTFDKGFSKVSAQDFLRQYLDAFFKPAFLLIGYDFRFGHKGEGDFSLIESYFARQSVPVAQAKPFSMQGKIISSSYIRKEISRGHIEAANCGLGRNYALEGRVVQGQKLGRQLGFPTANLAEIETMIPGRGVYHCLAKGGSNSWSALVNIGLRPTVAGEHQTVEAHLLDFEGDLYGQKLRLEFLSKIRDEKKFENLDKLKEQIQMDVKFVKGKPKNGG